MKGTSVEKAQKILGQHFLGTEDAAKHFRVDFSGETFDLLARIPYSSSVLQRHKETHILFPGCNLRIQEIQERVPRKLFHSRILAKDSHAENFAWERVRPCWHLMQKEVVPDSVGKTKQEHHAVLGRNEMVPRACEAVSMIILYYLVTGVRLFQETYARSWCAPYCVDVGFFGSFGLEVEGMMSPNKARQSTGIAPVYQHFQYEPLSLSKW